MPDVVVYERRRAGGDLPGVVRMRRRAGGDVSLSLHAPSTPVTPADDDIVSRFLAAHPFYVSHRMGGTEFPEFTQAGLDASLRAGFKALEISVRRCASGEFVAIHDWKTSRTVPGTDYQIWNTSWETLRGLRQASGGFMRLTDIVDQIPDDVVLAIDHKTTSSEDQRNPGDLASEEALLEYLDTAFGGHPERRIIWKVFARGTSAERARNARRLAGTGPWPCCTRLRSRLRTCPSGTSSGWSGMQERTSGTPCSQRGVRRSRTSSSTRLKHSRPSRRVRQDSWPRTRPVSIRRRVRVDE